MEDQYAYQTLQPSLSIRLLRLLPSKDATATLRGQLFEYSLEEMYTEASSYDALSYAWGNVETSEAISIEGLKLPITTNLHGALIHLRHQHVERLLWVDQLCIDQNNDKEKEGQIKLMSQIYACANCVIVWLGEREDDSDSAMDELRTAGREWSTKSKQHEMARWMELGYVNSRGQAVINNAREDRPVSDGVSRLFQRPWFHRIWVLQEVGVARRVQIRCGRSIIDGYTFALAAEVLKPTSETRGKEQALHNIIQSAAFLIQQSIFKPVYHGPPTSTGEISTFGELVDMFHNREATKNHDKIYALLGMSSTDMDGSGLLPDYTVPFGQLFERLIKFIISNQLTIECKDDKEAAVFKGRGRVLGSIYGVEDKIETEHRQRVSVYWVNGCGDDSFGRNSLSYDLRSPAIPLQEGDIIILLEEATKPSIIRIYEDFSAVIVAVAMLRLITEDDQSWTKVLDDSERVRRPTRDFVLIWDWHYSLELYSHLERYATWAEFKGWTSAGSNLIETNRLDDLARFWECAAIQLEGQNLQAAFSNFKLCLREFEKVLQIRELHTQGKKHILALIYGMIGESSVTFDSRSGKHISFQEATAAWFVTSLFQWAIQECHNNVIDLLIGTGHVHHNFRVLDHSGLDGLWSLLESNGVKIDIRQEPHSMTRLQEITWDVCNRISTRDHHGLQAVHAEAFCIKGMTALQTAAEAGSFAAVEQLLEMGADVNASAGERGGQTALQAAAKMGNMYIVDRLLRQNADVNQEGASHCGRTALQAAAEAGQFAVVQCLVQHHADINAPAAARKGTTALQAAAGAGHLQIVEYLLENKADVNAPATSEGGKTALHAAAEVGHLEIVECLLKHKADANAPGPRGWVRTALQAAAEAGYLEIVECLLEHKADVNAPAAFYSGRTAVQAAAEAGQMAIFQRLVHHRADINAPASGYTGRTALQAAAEVGHLEIVEYLLEHKADVNAPAADWYGRTALQAAAESGHLQIVEWLLEHNADVNASKSTHKGGRTALEAAAWEGHFAIVERLKQAGARPLNM